MLTSHLCTVQHIASWKKAADCSLNNSPYVWPERSCTCSVSIIKYYRSQLHLSRMPCCMAIIVMNTILRRVAETWWADGHMSPPENSCSTLKCTLLPMFPPIEPSYGYRTEVLWTVNNGAPSYVHSPLAQFTARRLPRPYSCSWTVLPFHLLSWHPFVNLLVQRCYCSPIQTSWSAPVVHLSTTSCQLKVSSHWINLEVLQ